MKKEILVIPKDIVRKAKTPYLVPGFKTGKFMTEKDRPRKKDWKKSYRKEDW